MKARKIIESAEDTYISSNMTENMNKNKQAIEMILLIQNALKAYVYLITQFMGDFARSREAKQEPSNKGSRGRKKRLHPDV